MNFRAILFVILLLFIEIFDGIEISTDSKYSIALFKNKSYELRKKLKGSVRLKYEGPSNDIRYSAIQQLEYPGNNVDKLAKITELWEEYYDCLDLQYASLGHHKRIPPIAITVLENRNVHLECDLCQSPKQVDEPIIWYKIDSPFGTPIKLCENDYIIFSQLDRLSIYRVQREFGGIYYCQSGDTKTNPYYLHVFGENEQLIDVKPFTAKIGPYALNDQDLGHNLFVTTVWSQWTDCSTCDRVGRKKKFGACTVLADIANNKSEIRLTEELKMGIDSIQIGYFGFLLLFTDGLPCRSKLLPMWIRKDTNLRRPNEIMTAFCKVPCKDILFTVKDKFGNLLEMANNSAGIFSTLQGPPHLLPMISRATFYCPLNEPFMLLCPGTLFIDAPTEWYVNKTIKIIPWIVERDSNGRMYIDSRERLSFKTIQTEDARIYSCWQGGHMAGIVRIVTYDSNAIIIDHHMILAGTIIILSLFVYLFVRIYLNKTKAAQL